MLNHVLLVDLSLSPFVSKLQETLRLETEKVSIASPQRTQLITKHVYRGSIKIEANRILDSTGSNGKGIGGIEVVHPDWAGIVVLETEGTHEHASLLIARVSFYRSSSTPVLTQNVLVGRFYYSHAVANHPRTMSTCSTLDQVSFHFHLFTCLPGRHPSAEIGQCSTANLTDSYPYSFDTLFALSFVYSSQNQFISSHSPLRAQSHIKGFARISIKGETERGTKSHE